MTRGTMRVQPQLLAEMFNYGMTDEGSWTQELKYPTSLEHGYE